MYLLKIEFIDLKMVIFSLDMTTKNIVAPISIERTMTFTPRGRLPYSLHFDCFNSLDLRLYDYIFVYFIKDEVLTIEDKNIVKKAIFRHHVSAKYQFFIRRSICKMGHMTLIGNIREIGAFPLHCFKVQNLKISD